METKRLNRKPIILVSTLLILALLSLFIILNPVSSYGYVTSGCVGLGDSTHEVKRYSVIKGERDRFYDDKKKIDRRQFDALKVGCDTDTRTHQLFIF